MKERQTSFDLSIAVSAEPVQTAPFGSMVQKFHPIFSHSIQGKKTLQVTHMALLPIMTLPSSSVSEWFQPSHRRTWKGICLGTEGT